MGGRAPRSIALAAIVSFGCRPAAEPTEPQSEVASREPTATSQGSDAPSDDASGPSDGASDPATERYLAEERWNAATPEALPPEPRDLRPPTEAEFKAWDRKDPEGEKHLYRWDKANFSRMQSYFHDLECFRARMMDAGEAGRGAKPGSTQLEAWQTAKRTIIMDLDQWQKQLFANDPRIFEKSKFVARFLEAHELVMIELPRAYNEDDQVALDRADAHWQVIVAKVDKYARNLGQTPTRASDAHCRAMATP